MLNRKIKFVANGIRCALEVQAPRQYQRDGEAPQLSICGEAAGSAGQNTETVREAGEAIADIQRICDIWDEFHLNTVPAEIVAELESILDRLDGGTFGEAPDVSEAPEISGDMIDSRDVIAALEIYRAAVVAMGVDPETVDADFNNGMPEGSEDWDADQNDIVSEFVALRELDSECESYGDWSFGSTLIRESYFTEYAEDFANDIGAVNRNASWPNTHIDWEAAAHALKQDYSEVQFKGETYLIRD